MKGTKTASATMATHYTTQHNTHYGYVPPPSPPMDESSRCSLPSISNLLGLADQGSPTAETHAQAQQCRDTPAHVFGEQRVLTFPPAQTSKAETRPNSSHYGNGSVMARTALPPSPPMSSDASFEGYNSPSTKSVSQLSSGSNYYFEATPPLGQMEADARHMAAAVPRVSLQASTYHQPHFAAPTFMGQTVMPSYYPPMQPTPPPQSQISGLYYQRPLPVCCSAPA
jgi:hypothetical protein